MKTKSPSKTKKQKPTGDKQRDICFVIMPFGGWFDSYYENIYRPAIEATGLHPRRADDLYRPSAIVHDIWDLTKRAKVLLADLSGKNPNVFYELGLAHAIARPAILVTESIDDVPFDLRSLRVIVYDKNIPDWGTSLQRSIGKAIKEILASPLDAVLPTFLKVKDTAMPSVTTVEKELISLRQDVDLLRRETQRRESYEDFQSKSGFSRLSEQLRRATETKNLNRDNEVLRNYRELHDYIYEDRKANWAQENRCLEPLPSASCLTLLANAAAAKAEQDVKSNKA